MHTEQALAISGMPSILTPAGGLRTEGMGDGWMIRGTDAEKARIPTLMGMPALPAPGSLAPRSFCPRCYMPLLWTPATDGIPLLRSTLAPPSQTIWIHILLYWLPTTPACWVVLSASLGLRALMYLGYLSLLHAVLPLPRQELESCATAALANSQTHLPAWRVQRSSQAAGCSQTLPQAQELLLPPGPLLESHASSCALLLFSLQTCNMSPGRRGGSFLLLFSSIASSNDNSTIHLLVIHLK